MTATQDLIDQLREELKNVLPTPPIGTMVIWYRKAVFDKDNAIAAIVTKVEDCGKISLTAFPPAGMPNATVRGCLHKSHKIHQKRSNHISQNGGAWDYPEGVNPPKAHFNRHKDNLNQRIATLELEQQAKESPKAAVSKG